MTSLLRCTFAIALAIGAAACGRSDTQRFGGDVRRGLEAGGSAATAWVAAARGAGATDEAIIAAGYLERLRLGLGSPLRLADYALADPRLGPEAREHLAWALLRRTLEEQSYEIDPVALSRLSTGVSGDPATAGAAHLGLIEDAITESRDPRTGELAVRLAYALAAAEGTLSPNAPKIAAQAAAMVRDRVLVATDARTLLRTAEASHVSAFKLLRQWRQDRGFLVEQPTLGRPAAEGEREAMELAPRLAEALRTLPLRPPDARPQEHARAPLLTETAAARLVELGDSLGLPPQAPITIAARMYRQELLDQPWVSRRQRDARLRFISAARNEEAFAAELARLAVAGPSDVAPALTALAAAVGLRTYAQERVWFPGFGGPSTRELEERYGLAAVTFDEDLPAAWRPYLRRMVDLAFADLHLVMPALDLRGLRIHFGDGPEHLNTLAMHDPARRRLLLPPATSAGTIAHEVAHDLDWQVALRRYRVRGDYASDRATRRGVRGDRLAMHLQDLAHGLLEAPRPGESAVHATRPAEVFARNIDWFVAVALSAEGRSNGYLSSVQDDILTGYGTVRPPDVTGSAGDALITILDEVAPVYPRTRQWFQRTYGTARALTPYDLVRHVLEVGDSAGTARASALPPLRLDEAGEAAVRLDAVLAAREEAQTAIDQWVCRAPAASHDRALELARRKLVVEAAGARARGLALRQARRLAGDTGGAWVRRAMYGAPWPLIPVDSLTVGLLGPLAEAAQRLAQAPAEEPVERFTLRRPAVGCADAPFTLLSR